MADVSNLISNLSHQYRDMFKQQRVILSFQEFLQVVKKNPRLQMRSAAEYIRDTFDHFGTRSPELAEVKQGVARYCLFDQATAKNGPIVGGEFVQDSVYNVLESFVRHGYSNKLILLHGPNGSAKTSTIESIADGMSKYSETDAGAAYRFNWIFPTDKAATSSFKGESGPIGFRTSSDSGERDESYAMLDDDQIASRIPSEFKDNPIYLIPMPQREIWLREWIAESEGIKPDDVELPPHILYSGLSKRNQLIVENLLSAYDGDLSQVLRHVQVERYFYSRQYRVGISTVEPQMAIDAQERQLTMDKNIANLPTVLHNIRFHECAGELIEANRGLLEFSDLLKRPLEAFKYLLTSVEKSSISLPSSTANLDIVFMATTNEKHLDSFKTIPDFSSFRGRFEFITVPYLLRPSEESQIYARDVQVIGKNKKFTPHTVQLLCTWAVMTRLKQPDPEYYDSQQRALIARLDPRSKVALYEGDNLNKSFKPTEAALLRELRNRIMNESVGSVVYEGRFGASPREIRGILQRAAQNQKFKHVSPMAMFEELERIVKDRTTYEFLQFEPRGKYHDAAQFIRTIKDEFCDLFEDEALRSMSMVAEDEYDKLLSRYVEHVVASVKKERIYNSTVEQYEAPSEAMMKDIEKIIGVSGSAEKHRENLLSRIAAYKLDHPDRDIDVTMVFDEYMKKIQEHYYGQRKQFVDANFQAMLAIDTDNERNISEEDRRRARDAYSELDRRFGYEYEEARDCLKFLLKYRASRSSK